MQVQNTLVVQPHVSVNLLLLMVKATLSEIVPEHVKGTKLNAYHDENVDITLTENVGINLIQNCKTGIV